MTTRRPLTQRMVSLPLIAIVVVMLLDLVTGESSSSTSSQYLRRKRVELMDVVEGDTVDHENVFHEFGREQLAITTTTKKKRTTEMHQTAHHHQQKASQSASAHVGTHQQKSIERRETATRAEKLSDEMVEDLLMDTRFLQMSMCMSMEVPPSSPPPPVEEGNTTPPPPPTPSTTEGQDEGREGPGTPSPTSPPITLVTAVPTPDPTTLAPSSTTDVQQVVLSYQQDAGLCNGPATGVGCASETPGDNSMGGNPNSLLNCFDMADFVDLVESATTTIEAVRFWVGASDLPSDLSVRVWQSLDGTVESGPGALLFEQELLDYVAGENMVALDTDDSLIPTDGVVCVGVYSEALQDGLRIQTETGPPEAEDHNGSFLLTPSCGFAEFTSLSSLMVRGDFCIEALVAVSS